ncbi:histidine--tRNA ligase [Spiroplasma endosymbiont of Crioceris asparagi]|uniref:histidine--tRNA ligase n=1 Tax=Spiroplasma endosymbiont of Crioceris asparagi TaxID=3066286 RepID=UPI0030D4FDEE
MTFQKPRGTEDKFFSDAKEFFALTTIIRNVMDIYNYSEIKTPTFENANLFKRSVGDETDVVSKEMYTFLDKKNRELALKPEGTASIIRSVVENKLYSDANLPLKLFYIDSFFRYERPQSGRNRQFNQFGVEVFGKASPELDVELVAMAITVIKNVGLEDKDFKVNINYLVSDKEKSAYINDLKQSLQKLTLCDDCQIRIEKNILRVLDCKIDQNKFTNIPNMSNYLSAKDQAYFGAITKIMKYLNIDFEINSKLVRGLDYYTGFIFEINLVKNNLTLLGGGRYDNLVKQLDGPDLSGAGFGMGIERLLLELKNQKITLSKEGQLDAFIVGLSEKAKQFSAILALMLRTSGLMVDVNYQDRSLKSSFKFAESIKSKNIIIIGDNELKENVVVVKNLITKVEQKVKFDELVEFLK